MPFSKGRSRKIERQTQPLTKDSFIAIWKAPEGGSPLDQNIYAYFDSFCRLLGPDFLARHGIVDVDSASKYFGIGQSHKKMPDGGPRYLVQTDAIEWALHVLNSDSYEYERLIASLRAKGITYSNGRVWVNANEDDLDKAKDKIFEVMREDFDLNPKEQVQLLETMLKVLDPYGLRSL
ncbi:MAG: hypothetical protein AAGA46_00140 [Cyanobacteria bacterium P01_F01_bin.13]